MSPRHYLNLLLKLPHRGTGTQNAKLAAAIIANEYEKLGLTPHTRAFRVLKNGLIPLIFQFVFFISSLITSFLGNDLLGLVFLLMGLWLVTNWPISLVNFIKLFYGATGYNVYTTVAPRNKTKHTIVIFGHYDTARAAIGLKFIGATLGRFSGLVKTADKKMPNFFRGILVFTNIAIIFNILILLLNFSQILFSISILLAVYALIAYSITLTFVLLSAFSQFVPGAFDNGSGTSTIISLASYYSKHPLKNIRLIFLNNGGEEALAPIPIDDIDTGKSTTTFINLDSVGMDKLAALYGETDRNGISRYYNKELYALVENVIQKNQFNIEKMYLPVTSDCSLLVKNKCSVMTTMLAVSNKPSGYVSHYHQMEDTIEKVNLKSMDLCKDFVIELINETEKYFKF